MTQSLNIRDQEFILHPTGGLYWVQQKLLLISDVHLGKVTHFRKYGAAIPMEAMLRNYELLNQVLRFFQPGKICFLGDLFHSYYNKEWVLFAAWRVQNPLPITLVTGNHDIISPLKFESVNISCTSRLVLGEFLLTHHPVDEEGYFNFSGHIHPAVRLRGKGRQSLRLPCFFKQGNQLILPAFGEFTGNHTMPVSRESEVYAITDSAVVKI